MRVCGARQERGKGLLVGGGCRAIEGARGHRNSDQGVEIRRTIEGRSWPFSERSVIDPRRRDRRPLLCCSTGGELSIDLAQGFLHGQ